MAIINVKDVDIVSAFNDAYARYSVQVLFGRSLPGDDGLKVSVRRTLYAMYRLKAYKGNMTKTAKISGCTIGTFHPHGDSSVEGAIAGQTAWWLTNYPTIANESNFGSMQGDGPAAARYTECSISDFAYDVIFDELSKFPNVVDWLPTYDNKETVPEVLPTKVPLLLVNGCFGIAIGLICGIPPHPLGDVIDETIKLIKNPNHKVYLEPDQCMIGEIISSKENIKEICETGNGKFRVRGVIDVVPETEKSAPELVIRSTPDFTAYDRGDDGGIKSSIERLQQDGTLPMIMDIVDSSVGDDMHIVLKLRKNSNPELVRSLIYKHTQMQRTFSMNFETVRGTTLRPYKNYKDYLLNFINWRRNIKHRMLAAKISNLQTRKHSLEPFIRIYQSPKRTKLDGLIYKTPRSQMVDVLIREFNIDPLQVDVILNSRAIERNEEALRIKQEEYNSLGAQIEEAQRLILDQDSIDQEIINEMLVIKKKHAKPRKTKLLDIDVKDDGVIGGNYNVVITEGRYIKKYQQNDTNISNKDTPRHVVTMDNRDTIILFTQAGDVYKVKVDSIPVVMGSASGKPMVQIDSGLGVPVVAAFPKSILEKFHEKGYTLVVATHANSIKRMPIDLITNGSTSKTFYTSFKEEGDYVVSISLVKEDDDIILWSDKAALRVRVSDIPILVTKSGGGSNAMRSGSTIDGFTVVHNGVDTEKLVVITVPTNTNGICRVNKINSVSIEKKNRGSGVGSKVINCKNSKIKSIIACSDKDNINMVTSSGALTVRVADLPDSSSICPGVELNMNRGDIVIRAWRAQ